MDKHEAAVLLGSIGGSRATNKKKGLAALSKKERRRIAQLAADARRAMGYQVYLAENLEQTLMKIGVSYNPKKRMFGMRTATLDAGLRPSLGWRLLASMPGDFKAEAAIQKEFSHLSLDMPNRTKNKNREWFHHAPEIATYFQSI